MRGRARAAAALAAALALGVVSPTLAGASGPPNGDRAAIALERQAASVFNARAQIAEVAADQYFWGYSSGTQWRLDDGAPSAPYPYEYRVNDDITLAVAGGRTAWELNDFVCAAAGGCGTNGSLVIYGSSGGVYWGTTTGVSGLPTCWNRAGGQTQWMVTGYSPGWVPWDVSTGKGYGAQHYVSVSRRSGVDTVTSHYKVDATGVTVTEVDTIRDSTKVVVATTYRVSARVGQAAYSYTYDFSYPSVAPTAPTLSVCSSG